MLTNKERELVLNEISGEATQVRIAEIAKYDRLTGTRQYHQASEYVRQEFVKAGVKDTRVHRYPVRPGQRHWAWASEHIWEPLDAELCIVEPKTESRALCRFPEDAMCLLGHSTSTPAQGIKAEIVDVGPGDHPSCYQGKSLRGKLALISGTSALACYTATVRYGALGVITCSEQERFLDFPDMVSWNRISTHPRYAKQYFGFSVSRRQMEYLKTLLHKGNKQGRKVMLWARVQARFKRGVVEVIDACIKGRKPKERGEVVFVAHLCHARPSANDNASGAALSVELARVLVRLVKEKKLKTPEHNIRFLVMPEWSGSVPWVHAHHKYVKKNVRALLALDMVGEDQLKCGSTLKLAGSPDTIPSYLTDVTTAELEWAGNRKQTGKLRKATPFRWGVTQYYGWSDNMPFSYDPVKVPNVSFVSGPDYFYHSSGDTVDKTDANVLEKIGTAALATALDIVNADNKSALRIVFLTACGGIKRLISLKQSLIAESSNRTAKWSHEQLDYFAGVEKKRIGSVLDLVNLKEADSIHILIAKYQRQIDDFVRGAHEEIDSLSGVRQRTSVLSGNELKASKIIPHKLFIGPYAPACFMHKINERAMHACLKLLDRCKVGRFDDLIMLYVDGQRSIYDIYKLLSYQRGTINLKSLMDYFNFLVQYGLVKLQLKG